METNTPDDATALARLVASNAASPNELLDHALARVKVVNPELNAVVLIQEEVARKSIRAGLPDGPFKGVPFLIKDLGAEAIDFPSHNGSNLLRNTTYTYDSEIFRRIRATGVVTFGRTTSPEGGLPPSPKRRSMIVQRGTQGMFRAHLAARPEAQVLRLRQISCQWRMSPMAVGRCPVAACSA
jgi:Asp-tRNA(Asn)/Glu-tRNA(Gln) amidotransferase A subunit family amidase